MKFSSLTIEQKKALLDNPVARDNACELEAVDRGITVPITLPDLLIKTQYVGYQIPAQGTRVFEICVNKGYSDNKPTGMCFLTREKAEKAMVESMSCFTEGYSANEKWVLKESKPTVMERFISLTSDIQKNFAIEPYEADLKAYQDLCDEIYKEITQIVQEDHNKEVNQIKRAKYLELALGNEDIAKGFWNNVEKTGWPEPTFQEATA
jgi:hypothetical protein